MGTVFREGPYRFVVHSDDHAWPHVHVQAPDFECMVYLRTGRFRVEPPERDRRAILEAFKVHLSELWAEWYRLHPAKEEERG